MHLQFVFPQFCFCCSESVARWFPNSRFRNSLVHLNSANRVTYCMSSCWLCSLNSFTATERVIAHAHAHTHAHQVGNVKLSCWTTTNHMIVCLKCGICHYSLGVTFSTCFRLCVLEEWNFARIIAVKLFVKTDIFFVCGSCYEWYPWEEKSITAGIVIFCIHARNMDDIWCTALCIIPEVTAMNLMKYFIILPNFSHSVLQYLELFCF